MSTQPTARTRGIATPADLRRMSTIDPLDRNPYDPCWTFTGALGTDGRPRIHTWCHAQNRKRSMSGPTAVWNIKTGKAPGDRLPYRTCFKAACVNPGHHALAADYAEIGRAAAAAGSRKGKAIEQRRAAAAAGRAVQGIVKTPADIVEAIQRAPAIVSGRELAALLGVTTSVVSRYRRQAGVREAA